MRWDGTWVIYDGKNNSEEREGGEMRDEPLAQNILWTEVEGLAHVEGGGLVSSDSYEFVHPRSTLSVEQIEAEEGYREVKRRRMQ